MAILGVILCFILIFVLFDRMGRLEKTVALLEKDLKQQHPQAAKSVAICPVPADPSKVTPATTSQDIKTAPAEAPQTQTSFFDGGLPPKEGTVCTERIATQKTLHKENEHAVQAAVPALNAAADIPTFPPQDTAPKKTLIDWETFTAGKLFSWIGGFTLLLAVVFFIKYSIENDLISPEMRVILSALFGLILLGTGCLIKKESLKITADTLCGSGLAVMYAAVFSAHAFYQLIGSNAAFAGMAAVALGSFGVAVWKKAKYVGFLAQIIAFLTPFLLSSGGGHTLFFFSYVAFINAAAAAAALKRGWNSLLISSAVFTALCQAVIMNQGIPTQSMGIFCAFSAVYATGAVFAAIWYKERLSMAARNMMGFFLTVNLVFVLAGVSYYGDALANAMQFLLLGLWLNLLLAFLLYTDKTLHAPAFLAGKVLVFLSLLSWTQSTATPALFPLMMGAFLAFAAVNGGADFLMYKKRGVMPGVPAVLFPTLFMLPLLLQITSFGFYAFVMAAVVMAFLLAVCTGFALLSGKPKAALFACALFILALICAGPKSAADAWTSAGWTLVFALSLIPSLLISGAAFWLRKKNVPVGAQADLTVFVSALMPYILVFALLFKNNAAVSVHLVMGFLLALNILCGFFVYLYKNGKPLVAALAGSSLVQAVYLGGFLAATAQPQVALPYLAWTAGIFAFFTLYPFLFKKRFMEDVSAWAVCALCAIPAALLTYQTLQTYYQIAHPGLLPLGFALLYLAAVNTVYYWQPLQEDIQRTRLSFLGGVTLLFITLIFPLEFSKEWLTVAWALEGAGLIYLNRVLGHKGLTRTGFALLTLVFIRLLFNNMLYHVDDKIFNHYLYTFGVSTAAMLFGAYWWKPKEEKKPTRWLQILGGITLFDLMNIEIANYFSQGGSLRFDLFGDFASAAAYTLGWALFGAVCLFLGLAKKTNGVRRAGTVLISLALLKLFLSDIWALGGLYRIFGLFGVAAVLMLVSFGYQRFKSKL